jgi:hypothetical protein
MELFLDMNDRKIKRDRKITEGVRMDSAKQGADKEKNGSHTAT